MEVASLLDHIDHNFVASVVEALAAAVVLAWGLPLSSVGMEEDCHLKKEVEPQPFHLT